jgi:dipeptidyl aminopeptidase/acylaminoacyl peptidase
MKHLFAAALLLSVSAPALAQPAPYEAGDIFKLSQVENPVLSPDGKRVIFMRRYADIATDRRLGELWLMDVASGDRRLLIGGQAGAGGVQWSPDGTRIAYVAPVAGKPQIHVMSIAEGIGRPLTAMKTAPSTMAWSPDGKSIAFVAQVDAKPVTFEGMPAKPDGATWAPEPRVVDSFRYRLNEGGYLTPGFRHLFVVDATPGAAAEPRQITKGDFHHVDPDTTLAWTPDSTRIVAAGLVRADADRRGRDSDLFVFSLDGAEPRQLTSADGVEAEPAVSPDGQWVAYSGAVDRQAFYVKPDVWVIPIGGGQPRNLTKALDRPVQGPQWARDGRLYAAMNDAGLTRIIEATPGRGGGAKPRVVVPEIGGTRLYLPSSGTSWSAAAGGRIAAPTRFEDRPAGLGVWAAGGRSLASLDLNADWRATKAIGKLERVTYPSRADGKTVEGWLLYPPDFDPAKKYPLILDIHGGPNTDYGPYFSTTLHLYAARGYLVLYTNPRGSIGYGEDFANFFGELYPSKDHDDLMSGVDAVAKRPYVDARNLFITGGSGGGVLTLWAIAKEPDKFRAAVALRPVTDWTVQALSSDIQAVTAQYWLGGANPWDGHATYWQQSPLSLVGKVKTPTMLITGEADDRTPIAQTECVIWR